MAGLVDDVTARAVGSHMCALVSRTLGTADGCLRRVCESVAGAGSTAVAGGDLRVGSLRGVFSCDRRGGSG